ncbi:MAG: 2-isopropylmalate synthase [Venatoribacter sp.]
MSFDYRKYQAAPVVQKPNRRWPDQTLTAAPIWCSVDLRDGNQALIDPMTVSQKQRLWALLVKMGFKEIEVGFPSASKPDYDFVRWLIEENQIPDDVTIQVLTQAREDLIVKTFAALKNAKRAVVHVYNSTSRVQREKVFKLDKQGILDIAVYGAKRVQEEAQKYPQTQWVFEYSPESFSSTEVDFAVEVCNAVIDVWQPTPERKIILNLPDTVQLSTPNVYADQIEWFCDNVHKRDSLIISIHPHNDRGCGVATAELAMMAGADRVEGTLLGNGERTGNLDITTVAMNLYSHGIDPKLDLSIADEIIATSEAVTQIKVHPRHPWFGELVYTAFSGSHQDAIRKCLSVQEQEEFWDVAYLPIDPQDIGRNYQSVIRVNSQSGKGGASYLLEQKMGITLPRWMQIELAGPVQKATEAKGGELNTEDIEQVFNREFVNINAPFSLVSYQLDKTDDNHKIKLIIEQQGQQQSLEGQGNGAISAFANAMQQVSGLEVQIVQFDEQTLGEDSHADAIAFIQANIAGKRHSAVAQDNDSLSAGFKAILGVVNKAQAG